MTPLSHALTRIHLLAPLLACSLMLTTPFAHAQSADGPDDADSAPTSGVASSEASTDDVAGWIDGTAEDWYDDPEAGTRTLVGNVRMDRLDGSGYLYADTVTMPYESEGDSGAVDETVADGNVRVKEGDVVATCDHAVFTEGNNVIHLTGSVVVLLGRDRMECEDFTLDRRTGQRHGSGGVRFRVRLSEEPSEEDAAPEPESEPGTRPDFEPSPPADAG